MTACSLWQFNRVFIAKVNNFPAVFLRSLLLFDTLNGSSPLTAWTEQQYAAKTDSSDASFGVLFPWTSNGGNFYLAFI